MDADVALDTAAVPEDHAHDNYDEDEACNQRKFFIERDQVIALLTELAAVQFPSDESAVDDEFTRKHKTVTTILDRYLEQSNLLDPFLRQLLAPLLTEIQRVIRRVADERRAAVAAEDSDVAFPCQLYRNPKLHALFQLVYHLTKVRGYKTIVKLLPHEVSDFEPTLLMLQSQDRTDHSAWETRFILLLWLSMLCLVPFDLNTIDSSASASLVPSILTLCKGYLADAGTTQLAAAVCLARLLSRPDMEAHHLERFLSWSDAELQTATATITAANPDQVGSPWRVQQFKITGIMRCLAYLAKYSPRDKHIGASRLYFGSVMQLIDALSDEDHTRSSSTGHRKLSVKLVQRLGLLYLPPRVQAWRYQRGLRSLEMNMQRVGLATTTTASTASQDGGHHSGDDDSAMAFDAVEELEQIVDVLLTGLRDKDTVVRWSAAKGIGRLTGRLPFAYADDVVQSVLELFVATEGEGAWHGASLALAELTRRGVLLPHRLAEAVDCVARALQYDIRRGAHSLGAHVRDAACYACWSFARAYEPLLLLPHLDKTLAPAMLITCVFDRELHCRRAASAAFQESVGRQGRTNFPHGIELLTRADYFSVANVRHAFLDVSVFIASFPQYRYALLEHLVTRKLVHWDAAIRHLSAQALGKICALDPAHTTREVLPHLLAMAVNTESEVIARHGATLAVAHVVRSLVLAPANLDGELQARLKQLPLEIDKRRLFRGRGGETIRSAVCLLIETLAMAGVTQSLASIKTYLTILEECLVHPVTSVRTAAIDAFAAFTRQIAPGMLQRGTSSAKEFLLALMPRYLSSGVLVKSSQTTLLNPNVAVRRGLTRAIGVAAKELLQPTVGECLRVLCRAATLSSQSGEEPDAESRVAAVETIVDICSRVTDGDLRLEGEDEREAVAVVETLVACVQLDYATDERGDVGSWVRKVAMLRLEKLLLDKPFTLRTLDRKYLGRTVKTAYGRGVITRVLGAPRTEDAVDEGDGGDVDQDALCHVAFAKPSFGFYYFAPLGIGKIRLRNLTIAPVMDAASTPFVIPAFEDRVQTTSTSSGTSAQPSFSRRLPVTVTGVIVAALVQQLAEKLDSIRVVAGGALFRLIHSTQPRVDGIPDRFLLEKQLLPSSLAINWAMAHDTFPIVVQMMDSPAYVEPVLSGLVLSVGGLTESVVKASKAALVAWIRSHTASKDFGLLSRVAFFLVTLLTRHAQDDRVTIPLMKTLAMLLEDGHLSFLFQARDDESQVTLFGERLYNALKDEIAKASTIPKLSAGVAVLVGLLPSEPQAQQKALKALVLFLGHRFPKVRKLTAERLYTRLLVHEDVIDPDKYDDVVDLLSATAWDGPIGDVRVARNEILALLEMEPPAKKQRIEDDRAHATVPVESYETLVKEVGY